MRWSAMRWLLRFLALTLLLSGGWLFANDRAHPASAPAAAAKLVMSSKPLWGTLSDAQRQALGPLAADWPNLSELQKRKWLSLSKNFDKLSPTEQTLLQSRMGEWAKLTASERTQARLNYAGVKQLSADERLAKWEAYQHLPAEKKQALAAASTLKPVGAAVATKPTAPQKLAIKPAVVSAGRTNSPKIAAGPHQAITTPLPPQPPVTTSASVVTPVAAAPMEPVAAPTSIAPASEAAPPPAQQP